jgi:acetylglutamate kinase
VSEEGATYNINADTVAGAVAAALSAKRMLLLTDVVGVLDKNGELIRQLTITEARRAIADGVATGGMIPKLETAIAAVQAGVEAVVILDGRRPHAMLTELFTEHGAGTLVRA